MKKKRLSIFALILIFALPNYLNAATSSPLNFEDVNKNLSDLTNSIGKSISEHLPSLPKTQARTLPKNIQSFRPQFKAVLQRISNLDTKASLIIETTLVGASEVAMGSVKITNIKEKVSQAPDSSVNSAQTAAVINKGNQTIKPAASTPQKTNVVVNTTPPATDNSLSNRLSNLEKQITSLRNNISRQSDTNVTSVVQTITQTVKDVASDGVNAITAVTGAFSGAVSINGALTLGSASTTASNGINITAGCFSVSGTCVGGGSAGGTMTFSFPFTQFGSDQSTTTLIHFFGGFNSSASSTIGAGTTAAGLTISGGVTTTGQILSLGSSTFQSFFSPSATGTNLYATNFLANGSSTFQKLFSTSATGTNLYATNFLANGSSTFQKLFSTSATATSLYSSAFLTYGSSTIGNNTTGSGLTIFGGATTTGQFLSLGSSTFQSFFSPSATGTNLYATNFLANGSSTLQLFTSPQGTITSATSTNSFITNLLVTGSTTFQSATGTNFYASAALNVGSAINFQTRSTTTLTVNDTAWVIATNTAATASPLMSFNNSAGTSTIQFFGATTTGLTAGTGLGIPMGNIVIIGDGHAPSSVSIIKGGLCVDIDGWCSATTTGRISSVSSYIGNSDLAEMYQAGENLDPGDVVSITSGIVVKKAQSGEKEHMMGVVSTKPGIVLGSGPDAEGRTGDIPVALAGRVPVKVSTEQGVIHAGDYLALSSTAGVAMRATRAGTTIGQALEDYSGGGTGKILAFIKNSYYSGLSLENFAGLTVQGASTPQAILAALENGANNQSTASADLTVDRMLAAVEIITPKITAGLVSATTIQSPTIDALSNRITTETTSLMAQINSTNAALELLTSRVAALESASSTNFAAAITSAVQNTFASTTEWVLSKITAALGVFNRVEVGTAHISQGIEMTDSATGELYCITLKDNNWDKTLGPCGSVVTSSSSSTSSTPPVIDNTSTTTSSGDTATTTDTASTADTTSTIIDSTQSTASTSESGI